MSNAEESGQDWRESVSIDEEHEDGPTVVLNATGDTAADALRRVVAEGKWDEAAEPAVRAALELAAELIEAPGVVSWVDDELRMAAEDDEAKAVRFCFHTYQDAILNDDGKTAAALLDDNTLQRYERYRRLALNDQSPDPNSDSPIIDNLCIALFQLFLTEEQLQALTPLEIIEFAIDHLFAGKRGAEDLAIGQIEVDGDSAYAEAFVEDQQLPTSLAFHKQNGVWRVDITSLMPVVEMTYAVLAEESKMSPDDFIAAILQEIAGEEDTD